MHISRKEHDRGVVFVYHRFAMRSHFPFPSLGERLATWHGIRVRCRPDLRLLRSGRFIGCNRSTSWQLTRARTSRPPLPPRGGIPPPIRPGNVVFKGAPPQPQEAADQILPTQEKKKTKIIKESDPAHPTQSAQNRKWSCGEERNRDRGSEVVSSPVPTPQPATG